MPRYFLELAYKGTAYSGFQVQKNAPTIQRELEVALQVIYRVPFELTGSSRTDAGVHALQNYFHFDTELVIESRQVYNLNAVLPQDITVKGIYPVGDTAHCRFDAISRAYKYFIYNRKDPFMVDRGWMYPYPVNLGLLQEAATILMEYEDFTSFSKRNTQVKTFQCKIVKSVWEITDNGLVYNVASNRFLRGMVRGLVGTMLKLGREQMDIARFRAIIEAKDCSQADFTTPPQGLFLVSVVYPYGFLPGN
jgi:tRNA pseudouridine38-40 synthase